MAIDTKSKRFSMMNMGSPAVVQPMPDPDGTIDQGDRQHFLGLYSGIFAGLGGVSPNKVTDTLTITRQVSGVGTITVARSASQQITLIGG